MKFLNFPKDFKPIFVDWAITTKCHLNCTHCRYRGGKKNTTETRRHRELNKKQALVLAKEINKLEPQWILIEGGEPFLRKDIFDIIKTLKPCTDNTNIQNSKFKIQNSPIIYIISSGIGFSKELAKHCKDLGAKLMISLDSAIKSTYEKIRVGAELDSAVKAVKIAQKFKILDSINFTLQELNASVKEIKAIGKLANALDVKSINFLGLKPNAACATNTRLMANFDKLFSEITNLGDKYKINVKVDEPFYKPWHAKSKIKYQKSKIRNQGPIVADEKSGCIFGEYLFIEPDGTTKPCSFSPLSFEEIGFDVIKKIQNKRNRQGKCGQCKYQIECGGCRVRTYTLTGDWLASDPYCPL
jgi:radical SAM protein with 4Fe4S-binding SPASM domain